MDVSSVQFELLQESAEVATGLQNVQQGIIFQVTMVYDKHLLIEEGTKRSGLNKSYGFVKEQQCALQEDSDEIATYQKLCYSALKQDKPVKDDTKSETQTTIAPFGKKIDFDVKEGLVEEPMYGTIGMVMETLGWTQWHRLLSKLN